MLQSSVSDTPCSNVGFGISCLESIVDIWDSVAETLVILWQGCSFHADWATKWLLTPVVGPKVWRDIYVWASSNGACVAPLEEAGSHEGMKRAAWL